MLEDLNTLLVGAGPAGQNNPVGQNLEAICVAGTLPLPIRYVITLDTDTQLPAGTARRMVETISHPLNRVEIDPVTRVRKRGFTIVQPRVSIALPGATATRLPRACSRTPREPIPTVSPFPMPSRTCSAKPSSMARQSMTSRPSGGRWSERFPAETLLSHDLIEGAHVGVALASDIELFENLPLTYVSYCQRQHRWIRGDWQIAPWILGMCPCPAARPSGIR